MNPFDEANSVPNFWLSCLIIDEKALCRLFVAKKKLYTLAKREKSCPTEILEAIVAFNVECSPIWETMQMQPVYRMNPFVTRNGNGRARSNAYIKEAYILDVGADILTGDCAYPVIIK